jgi:UDP-N-acetylmuramoyl-tripeptide--D-alanyl-D-alanine ligase
MKKNFLWSGLGLVAPLAARVVGRAPLGVTGISIDTRTLEAGDLFIAIKGEVSDGHDYVSAAFDKGAAAAVVDEAHVEALRQAGSLFVVNDTLASLQGLGIAARNRSQAAVVAVTGSVGKTGTKEALALVLGQQGKTHAAAASYNNHLGVPLTLSRMPRDTQFGVFEIGMNHPGEITPLTGMVRPHVAIVTTVAPVHLEFFDSVDAIADAKGEIFSGLEPGGVAIIHGDISQTQRLRSHAENSNAARILTFGARADADAHLEDVQPCEGGSRVTAQILGEVYRYTVGAPGRHMAMNSLAVLLAVQALGADMAQAAEALRDFAPPKGRGEQHQLHLPAGPFTLVDESYNANPASMRAALSVLGEMTTRGRRIAVLGDMLELGPQGPSLHAELATVIEEKGIDLVFAVGPLMKSLFDRLPASTRGVWAQRADDIEKELAMAIGADDIVMIKGSNGSRMHMLVSKLKERFAAPTSSVEG